MPSDRSLPLRGAQIRARGWGWRHAGRRTMAVAQLNLDIEAGERVLLLGPSGAGKSTLLHALAGVLGADQRAGESGEDGDAVGELSIDGSEPSAARGRSGLVLQDPDSQVVLARVGDDVAFGCENLGVPREEIWPRVREALDAVGLTVPLDTLTAVLSGGQKQRLALAGVLAMQPGLILLDEPTANLDPDGVIEVRDAVARALARSKATFIVVEHRVAVWQGIVDRVIVLDPEGGVLADGTPESVLEREGADLAKAGVWIPGYRPPIPPVISPHPIVPPSDLLFAENLAVGRKIFGSKRSTAVAEGIDFTARTGDAIAVTGANGSGKSTLALTVAGLLPPVGGELRASETLADGAGTSPHRWRSRRLLDRIGTVFQDPEHQFLTGTVRNELAVGPRALRLSHAEIESRVDELLYRLRLERLAQANPFTLSGGEKRRLSVATALATRPKLLVLDEPTFGQDAITWAELVNLLAELLETGVGLVTVTHDAEFLAALGASELRLDPRQESQEMQR